MKFLPLLIILALGLSGCLDQDPLAGRHDKLKNAVPPGQLPEKPKPIDSNSVIIQAPNIVSVLESETVNMTVTARVTLDGYKKPEVIIENIANFEGASFDSSLNVFKWTPSDDFVGSGFSTAVKLKIRAYARAEDSKMPDLTRTHEVLVRVDRTFAAPKVIEVKDFEETMHEAERYRFQVTVEDKESGESEDDVPRIDFLQIEDGMNLAPFITLNRIDKVKAEKKWTFHFVIDLTNEELTNSIRDVGLSFVVANKFGKLSSMTELTGTLETSLQKPTSTWDDTIELKAGQENKFSFIIFDSKGEGELSLVSHNADTTAKLDCQGEGPLFCEFIWNPEDKKNDYWGSVTVVVEAKSKTGRVKSFNYWSRYKVIVTPKPQPQGGK